MHEPRGEMGARGRFEVIHATLGGGDGEKKKNTHRHDGNHKDGIWLKKTE